ncbi:MAG: hypothetical protein RLZZ502_20 [Pseudomonadota bacterium]
MQIFDWLRLLLLAAIWGSSFIFFRILTPVLGISPTTALRCFLAGLFLYLVLWWRKEKIDWRKKGKHFFIIGVLNSALPFACFAYASLHIPAAYSAILNSTAPIWGVLIGVIFYGSPISRRTLIGFSTALLGVILVANPWQRASGFVPDAYFLPAIGAGLAAAILYGIASHLIKKHLSDQSAVVNTAATQLVAGLALLPFAAAQMPSLAVFTPLIIASILAISLMCSALAYFLYYKLIADIGVERGMSVTFFIPVFGLLWGALFLGEAVSMMMLLGSALVICGTYIGLKK